MTKPTIVTRAGKGSALTWTEGDSNLTNLQNATIAIKADTGGTDVVSDLNGTVTLVAGSNVTITGDNTAKTVTIAAAGGSLALDDLTDVSATSPMSGDTLVWNNASSVWQAQAPSGGSLALDDLTDVNTTMVTDGQVLTYNNSLVRWEGTTISAGATTLDGLSDVVITGTPSDASFLVFDSVTAKWRNLIDFTDTSVMARYVKTVDSANTNASWYISLNESATGTNIPYTDANLRYNPSTNILTATGFAGALNGTVGATTPATGAFTTLSASTSVSFSPSSWIKSNSTAWTK